MQPLFILLGSALKLVNVITLVEDWKVLLGGVCVLLSWIALLVHDKYMDGDHIHGKDHYDFKWASLYVGVTCYFLGMCLCGETYVLFTLFVYDCDCGRWYLERNKPEYTLL